MKKKYIIIISCLLLTIILLGCAETPAHISLSRSIDKNLNNLSYTVSKLDSIDNNTIANPDMYSTMQRSSLSTTPSNNSSITKNLTALNPEENLSNYLLNKMITNYTCDSNGNCYLCNNSFGDGRNLNCSSCDGKIICDKFGNCTSCRNPLNLTNDGTCTNCNIKCIDGNCGDSTVSRFNNDFSARNFSNLNEENNCGDSYRNPLETNKISTISKELENNSLSEEENIDAADIIKNRFTSNYDKLENRNNQSFRNSMRRNEKNIGINDIEFLSDETDSANPETSNNQPKNLYYYFEESFSPDSLKYNPRFVTNYDESTTSDQLNNYVIKIQKLYAITNDVMEANSELASYKTAVLNRIESAKTLNNEFQSLSFEPNIYQIQALQNYLSDLKMANNNLRAVNGTINDQINNISTNNPTITSSIDIMNSNYLKLLNQLDIRITYHKNAIATLEQLSYILEDAMLNQNSSNDIINENIENSSDLEDLNNDNHVEDNTILPDSNNPSNNDEVIDLEDNNTSNNEIVENDEKTNNSLIDSYSDSSIKNIDTYKNNESIINDDNNEEISNTNIEDENNTILNDNFANVDSENLTSDETSNIDGNIDSLEDSNNNELINDENNNESINDNIDNNLDNRNGVINQNNLNTDGNILNESDYVYDTNGNLYNANNINSETNNENGFINQNSNSQSNVDTYSYNTLLDTINRGTVDNGINTLNISATNHDSQIQTLEYIDPETETDNNIINEEDKENKNIGGIRKSIADCPNGNCDSNGEDMEQESNELNVKNNNLEDPSIEFISDENI